MHHIFAFFCLWHRRHVHTHTRHIFDVKNIFGNTHVLMNAPQIHTTREVRKMESRGLLLFKLKNFSSYWSWQNFKNTAKIFSTACMHRKGAKCNGISAPRHLPQQWCQQAKFCNRWCKKSRVTFVSHILTIIEFWKQILILIVNVILNWKINCFAITMWSFSRFSFSISKWYFAIINQFRFQENSIKFIFLINHVWLYATYYFRNSLWLI